MGGKRESGEMKIREIILEIGLRLRVLFYALRSISPRYPTITPVGRLYVDVYRATGEVERRGLISTKVVTNAGVGYIVDCFQNIVELENMKYLLNLVQKKLLLSLLLY